MQRRHSGLYLLVLSIFLLGLLVGAPLSPQAAHASTSGLPNHFGMGVAAQPDSTGLYGWMPDTGIPWDYAYQYLAGGVNTNAGWETWNSNGQFPLYYAQGASQHGYIPVFPYYDLLQSNGTCGSCGEAQKDLSNLNNASLMASYYANFALLMKRLGPGTYDGIAGYGKTAIVHVEPDLSGYAEQAVLDNTRCYGYCAGQGNNPANLKASVAGSEFADVAGYPNTYQGFNWALLHLRDLYAPNVVLAFHVSNWATAIDVGSDTRATIDATALGTEAGSFAAQSGVSQAPAGTSTYDLIFNDVADRDAAYYKYVYNSNVFWDRLNVAYPNFHRWEQYLGAVVQATGGKPAFVWQIPLGNQYFDTENNTNGHYQDNRAEYFFGHVDELYQIGVVGLLFGAGNGGSTVNYDGMNDGVTNPASFCTTDGVSSGSVCNNHQSTVSDDDGGYLRMAAQQYYVNPIVFGTPTATPTGTPPTPTFTPTVAPTSTATAVAGFTTVASASPSTLVPGSSTTITASVTSGAATTVLVDVEVYDPSSNKVFQAYYDNQVFAAGQTRTYNPVWSVPTDEVTGLHVVKIGIFTPGWGTLLDWNNAANQIDVTSAAPTSTATATATPVPPTSTPTATSTPAGPTSTPTVTPTPSDTATPLPTGTPTPTRTPKHKRH